MQRLAAAITARGAHAARTVVLLPYAQLMPVARQFWAALAPTGFAPRFETTMNWARQCAWEPGELDLSFEIGRDLLAARGWLEQGGLRAQADALAGLLVEAAWQAAEAARAVPPADRAAWAESLRPQLPQGMEAPALATEAAIARIAFEWAAASSYATDALLDGRLTREVDLLLVLQGFQAEPVPRALVEQLGERALAWPLPAPAPVGTIALHAAADATEEAERAAACVLQRLHSGEVPVALAATDRVLTRRIGALLFTRGVRVHDETGWKLSTTRASAHVMGALRACAWDATADAVLDWLKNVPALAGGTVQGVERRVRRTGQREWRMLREGDWGGSESALGAVQRVAGWRELLQSTRTLTQWLDATRALLQQTGQWDLLRADAAGLKIIEALRLEDGAATDWSGWSLAQRRLPLREFTAWVNEVLEGVSFVPPHAGDEQVVVLPLSQLLGHPFAALVLPGCDERTLPASPEPAAGWSQAQRRLLGLPLREDLEAVQRAAWQHALQAPSVDILWRASDDTGERTLASPLVQQLVVQGVGAPADDPRALREEQAVPVAPPMVQAAQLAPRQLSATSYEDLRRCPYRFFALRMLGLKEADEIEGEVDKRDFGTWLHGVLKSFHEELQQRGALGHEERAAMLDRHARAGIASQRLGEGEFLPFAAGWPAVREGYLAWLAQHEAAGAVFESAESEHKAQLGAVTLQGRIDRIDRTAGGGTLVMDYKTESLQATRDRMKTPLEDTQLAFYAALLPQADLQAAYLNISERGEVKAVPHEQLALGAHMLQEAITSELRRIDEGAPLPALGEGRVCDFCAARGLCRRDGWSE
ncbi:PD-(D/E)XK nuclease family protein [Ramlibacter sp.]|uniref:PD-(D/E)XK nuclease family protein n=1 Tax=Ramlibacter sp. TaxID=1917967 RepID=UPI00263426A1|nr:PD-(D/E)XK nuclease family protein [Ramlibacter sp.]